MAQRFLITTSSALETEVLEGLGRPAVEPQRLVLISAADAQLGLGGPRRSTMARRGKLVEDRFARGDRVLGLVESALLEQSASEHELHVPLLVEEVDSPFEQLPRLLLRALGLAGAQMDLSE